MGELLVVDGIKVYWYIIVILLVVISFVGGVVDSGGCLDFMCCSGVL